MGSFLSWTFPAGAIFGIRLRVHWILPLIVLAQVLGELSKPYGDVGAMAIIMGLYLFAVLFHELAHCWMAIRLGGSADEIMLWPLGGLSYVGHSGSPRDELKISAIGPFSNFLIAGLCVGGLLATGATFEPGWLNPMIGWSSYVLSYWQHVLLHAIKVNMILGLFNLCVPAYPLDGGRILFAFLTIRHGRRRAAEISVRVAIPVNLVLVLFGLMQNQITLALIGIFGLIESWQLMQLSKMGELEAHPAFGHVSEYDFTPQRPRRAGFFARWRRRRAARRAQQEAAEAASLQQDVDAILEKVSREGIQSLTPDERRRLDEASRRSRTER